MKKLTLGLSIAALAIAGTAHAAPGGGADRNATVTRAEAQAHATQMFARMDANKDGKLDAADGEARRNARFDRMDTNKDGQISREEFAANHRPARPEGAATGQRPDRAEGKHRMGHRGKGRGFHGGGMMRNADANGDKSISQAEFVAAALQRFDSMDANKDGQVTREERQAARTAMREQRKARTPAAAPAAPAQPAS